MSEQERDKQDEIIELLKEILKWMKATSTPRMKNTMLELLKEDQEKIAYHHSDGKNTARCVADIAEVDKSTITGWWKKWMVAGIAEGRTVKGGGMRAARIFSLDEFGIELPKNRSKQNNVAMTQSKNTSTTSIKEE